MRCEKLLLYFCVFGSSSNNVLINNTQLYYNPKLNHNYGHTIRHTFGERN